MKYRVVITARAKEDLRGYFEFAARRAPKTAARWLRRFETDLGKLALHPRGHGLAPENDLVPAEIRQLLFGKRQNIYRALFTIDGNTVYVLHIRHAARDFARPEELGN